jgi:acyl phosphate:glycerol-3-phosphate acyltransferase
MKSREQSAVGSRKPDFRGSLGRIALCLILGYLVGSFPTAYLLVRWKSRLDIRNAGSGNVGTLNSFLVTRSWIVGASVLVVDCLKGAGAVFLGSMLGDGQLLLPAAAGAGAVVGHNYPVWLGFRGGKGLAPAAGVMAVLCWPVIPVWLLLWCAAFALVRSIDPANTIASGLILVLAAVLPLPSSVAWMLGTEGDILRVCVVIVMSVILLRHIAPLKRC